MSTLRSAIVGCGCIHHSHVKGIDSTDRSKLVAVCDIDKEKADNAAEKNECKVFYSFDDLMEYGEFDVLHICTPHYLHAEMAITALNKGKHVLTEKPLAISSLDAERMCKTAKEKGLYLGVCFQNRYNQSTDYIKEILDSDRLGKIKGVKAMVIWDRSEEYYCSGVWRGKIATEGGGVLINQAIHTLDLVQWFVNSKVTDIKASISTKRLYDCVETEDTADALITFENGVKAIFFASLCSVENSPVYLEIMCDKGKIVLSDKLLIKELGKDDLILDINRPKGEKAYWGEGHNRLIEEFYKSIIDNKEFLIDGESAKTATNIVEKIYNYARTK